MALLRAALEADPALATTSFGVKQWTDEQIVAANDTLASADELADAVRALLAARGARARREEELRTALANFVDVRDRQDRFDKLMQPIEDRLLAVEREYDALVRHVHQFPGLLRKEA
jgi:hypothetical protein